MGATAKDRSLFLKGFNLSTQGNYEDPTYLGFKIVFDFGGLPVDDFGQPPSPLFKDTNYTSTNSNLAPTNPFGQPEYDHVAQDEKIIYYSAQGYLEEREALFNSSTTMQDGINYLDPESKLGKAASKLGGIAERLDSGRSGGKRSDMLKQFKTLLQNINKNSPWFFQSIEGLSELSAIDRGDYNGKIAEKFSPQRTDGKSLTFNCLESMNLRMSALGDLYRMATFDAEYMRELLPRNLRYFKMFIFVTEIRNLNKTARLSGSAAAVKAVNDLSSYLGSNTNPGTKNTLNKIQGGINKVNPGGSSPGGSFNSFVGDMVQQTGMGVEYDILAAQSDQSGIKPVLMFECSQCEFDFDSSSPIKNILDIGSASAEQVTQSFKIHVGRVKVKNQYPNIRLDGLPLVLSDGWDSNRSSVQKFPRMGSGFSDDLLGAGKDLLTNFVSNALGDMITEGVTNLTSKSSGQPLKIFENVYNFSTSQESLDADNAYYSGSTPQEMGQGGPPDRIYPEVSDDMYPNSPGTDLGLPDRVYPEVSGDVYPNSPGTDLGLPDRVYPGVDDDMYPNSPGTDLGLPDRVYPGVSDDMYPNSPGTDLGLPDRVYPGVSDDVYPNSPGTDLGLPDRVYPGVSDDVYPNSPGRDLGLPDRIYPEVSDDMYPNSPGTDLGLPDRLYPGVDDDMYPNSPGTDLGLPDRVYPIVDGDVYPNSPGIDLGLPDRVYPGVSDDVYPNSPGSDLGLPDRMYPIVDGDVYPNSPGRDLGLPDRVYPGVSADVYPNSPGSDLGLSDRVYPGVSDDVYPNSPGSDLGLPDRVYLGVDDVVYSDNIINKKNILKTDVYPDSPGKDLGGINREYKTIKDDVYLNSPGTDLGIKSPNSDIIDGREYMGPKDNIYEKVNNINPEISLGRVYPETTEDFSNKEKMPNAKPHTKYDISLGDNHPKSEKYNE